MTRFLVGLLTAPLCWAQHHKTETYVEVSCWYRKCVRCGRMVG